MLARVLIVLLGLGLAAHPASAEQMVLPMVIQCNSEPGTIMSMIQEQYQEQPFTQGTGIIQTLQGQWMPAIIYTFLNPQTMSFSIVAVDPQTQAECLLLAGKDLAPIIPGDRL